MRLITALLLAALPQSGAQTGAPDVPPAGGRTEFNLTLQEATRRALARNHDIAIERESFRIASLALDRSEGAYDPSFHLEARYRDHTDPVNSVLSGAPPGEDAPRLKGIAGSASLTQLLPSGGTVALSTTISRDQTNSLFAILAPSYSSSLGIDLRQPLLQGRQLDPTRRAIRLARIDRDRSTWTLRRTVTETLTAVEKAYWTLVAARRDAAVRSSSVSLAGEQRSDAQARIEAGTLPESDLAQPVAEIERRRGELYGSEEGAERAENQLKELILGDAEDPLWNARLVPQDAPETSPIEVDLPKAFQEARSRRPELAEATARYERQLLETDVARERVAPQLDLVASYVRRGLAGDLNPNARSFTGTPIAASDSQIGGVGRSFGTIGENRFPDASAGLALTIPIGNRAARADYGIARSAQKQAVISLEQTRQKIAVEVRNAALALKTAAQRIESARAGRAAAETQLGAERDRFGVGLSTNFFVLTRQNELATAQVTETAALTDYRKALTDYSRAIGTLLEERNIQIQDGAPETRADGAPR